MKTFVVRPIGKTVPISECPPGFFLFDDGSIGFRSIYSQGGAPLIFLLNGGMFDNDRMSFKDRRRMPATPCEVAEDVMPTGDDIASVIAFVERCLDLDPESPDLADLLNSVRWKSFQSAAKTVTDSVDLPTTPTGTFTITELGSRTMISFNGEMIGNFSDTAVEPIKDMIENLAGKLGAMLDFRSDATMQAAKTDAPA